MSRDDIAVLWGDNGVRAALEVRDVRPEDQSGLRATPLPALWSHTLAAVLGCVPPPLPLPPITSLYRGACGLGPCRQSARCRCRPALHRASPAWGLQLSDMSKSEVDCYQSTYRLVAGVVASMLMLTYEEERGVAFQRLDTAAGTESFDAAAMSDAGHRSLDDNRGVAAVTLTSCGICVWGMAIWEHLNGTTLRQVS